MSPEWSRDPHWLTLRLKCCTDDALGADWERLFDLAYGTFEPRRAGPNVYFRFKHERRDDISGYAGVKKYLVERRDAEERPARAAAAKTRGADADELLRQVAETLVAIQQRLPPAVPGGSL